MKYKINLCDEYRCTQCFACQQICPKHCITRKESDAGFFIPEIDRKVCIECGACMSVCHKLEGKVTLQDPICAYACWTVNLQDREHSSSGGAFSAMATAVLRSGGVVFGAMMNHYLEVKHIISDYYKDLNICNQKFLIHIRMLNRKLSKINWFYLQVLLVRLQGSMLF